MFYEKIYKKYFESSKYNEKEIRKEVHKVKTNKVKPGYKKKIKKAIEKAKANHKKKIIQKNIKEKKKSSR